jgi:hypothetical protein
MTGVSRRWIDTRGETEQHFSPAMLSVPGSRVWAGLDQYVHALARPHHDGIARLQLVHIVDRNPVHRNDVESMIFWHIECSPEEGRLIVNYELGFPCIRFFRENSQMATPNSNARSRRRPPDRQPKPQPCCSSTAFSEACTAFFSRPNSRCRS